MIQDLLETLPPARPVLLAGPTASGKSALALAVAEAQGRVVVNADALQVYDCWQVLSARPAPDELARAEHALYGHVAYDAAYSTGHWLREVAPCLERDPAPIIIGGTGLYFMALTEGLADIPATRPEVREAASAHRARVGLETMADDLDPATRARIDLNNPMRVQRAWEVQQQTGRGLADWQAETPPALLPADRAACWQIAADPVWLNARIDRRFDAMMAHGALDEVRAILPVWDPALPSAKAIGAPELVALLRGEISESDAVARARIASHQYAKRQRTWFRRRMTGWQLLDACAIGA
ncbi:tRNA (adenosine(37)-N6)-dimethylallyltransferase MiaA [Fluviibacterium sp. DFM31]|uniref:tRNA dimethylallyltransferase n=1 Tax=Meridianimarinicoccus marinus TaxID=3231483 RepID=A0ABV3L269_9RHOB